MVWSGVVLFVVMLRWAVWMCNSSTRSMVQNFIKTMAINRSPLSPTMYFRWESFNLCNQKATVVLKNICLHLIAGSISENVKGFILIRISKEAILCHKCFYMLEDKIHFGCSTKRFLSRFTGERCKDMYALGLHSMVVVDITKEATHLW